MNKTAGKRIIEGAAIIGIASVIVKIIGAIFRIPLANLIGDTGMSYYNMAYVIYNALLILSISGMPVAVSRMVAERIAVKQYRNAHRVFHVAFAMMMVLGGISFLACLILGDTIARAIGNPESAIAIRAVSPALLIVPLVASMRGYFQGRQNMNPTAISEIIEQTVRAIVGLSLAFILVSNGLPQAAAGAAFGASAGSLAALLVIGMIYFLNMPIFKKKILAGDPGVESVTSIIKKIIYIAIPIIIGAEIMPIMNIIDASIIMNRLQATGWSIEGAKQLYGLYTGFIVPIIGLPQIFTVAVAVSLVPAIASSFSVGDMKTTRENIQLGMRTTMIMAFPCAFGIFALAKPIMLTLYFNQAKAATNGVPTLMLMAIGIVFLSLSQTSGGVLQAIGKQLRPVRNLGIGAALKIVISLVLVGIPSININGAAIGSMCAYIVALVLNMLDIKKYTDVKINVLLTYIKPGIASAVMALAAYISWYGANIVLGNKLGTVIGIMVGGVVYIAMIFIVKAITIEEIENLPRLNKLAKILRRLNI